MIDIYFWPTPNGYKNHRDVRGVGLKYNIIQGEGVRG